MPLRRPKKMLALAFVPIAALWVHALSQSFGEVGAMMGALPERQGHRSGISQATLDEPRFEDLKPPSRFEAVPRSRLEPVKPPPTPRDEPPAPDDSGPRVEPAPAAATPRAPSSRAARRQASDTNLGAEEFAYQRGFDPGAYERAAAEHAENLRPIRVPRQSAAVPEPAVVPVGRDGSQGRPQDPRLVPAFED